MMVFKVQLVLKFFFQCLVILLLFFNNVHSNDSVRLKWLELVPKYAYDFVPESGVTEEMWEDEVFLQKVEKAGLLINDEVLGKKIKLKVSSRGIKTVEKNGGIDNYIIKAKTSDLTEETKKLRKLIVSKSLK